MVSVYEMLGVKKQTPPFLKEGSPIKYPAQKQPSAISRAVSRVTSIPSSIFNQVRTQGLFRAATSGGITNKAAALAVAPLTAIGGFSTAAKSAVKSVGVWGSRQFINPLTGTTLKKGMSAFGKKVLGGTIMGAGAGVAGTLSYMALNEKANPLESLRRGALFGTAAGLNPIGALFGAGGALIQKGGEFSADIMSWARPNINVPQIPNTPSIPDYSDILDKLRLPNAAPINISVPSAPSMPSISISGGGGGDMTPALMLLLAAGGLGAGYLMGRKRRKRKKYKRGKRK